jgi:uncharacterized RDD family membrane protein YckC
VYCTNHAGVNDGLGFCERCSKPFCAQCLAAFQGASLCEPCRAERGLSQSAAAPKGELGYAALGRRFAAILVDAVILSVVFFVLILGLSFVGLGDPNLLGVFGVGVAIAYEAYFMTGGTGQTPGKKMLGVRVVAANGSHLTTGQSWGRSAAKLVGGALWGIGYVPALFTRERTALHDLIARTRVVRD